jgi:hypothetical protein
VVIPKEAFNGDFWYVPAVVDVECPRCRAITSSRPRVMRYIEAWDTGGEHKRFEPLWPERGWLVWWVCGACGWEWYKYHGNNDATTEEIQEWIEAFDRWYKSFKWEKQGRAEAGLT